MSRRDAKVALNGEQGQPKTLWHLLKGFSILDYFTGKRFMRIIFVYNNIKETYFI